MDRTRRHRDEEGGKASKSGGDATDRPGQSTEVREHLANERTLLSWVRTGVALISIGIVVERTGILLDASARAGSVGASEFFGIALTVLGVLTLVIGTAQFVRNRRTISSGNFVPSLAAYMVVVSGALAFAAAFIVYALFT